MASSLMNSSRCSRIFSGVPATTKYLVGTSGEDVAPQLWAGPPRQGHRATGHNRSAWPGNPIPSPGTWSSQQTPPKAAREWQRRQGTGRAGGRLLSPAAPCHGRLAAANLQVLLQDQHHLPVLLQAHGVGLHVLERGPISPAWTQQAMPGELVAPQNPHTGTRRSALSWQVPWRVPRGSQRGGSTP